MATGLMQGAPAAGAALSPQAMLAKMQLTPVQQQQLQRIVVAGMKVMFSPQTHQLMQQKLTAPGPVAQKLGLGVAGLLGLLMKESQNSIPKNLIIPAGLMLISHAADFLTKSGQPCTPQDIAEGMDVMIKAILQQAKIDPNKMQANIAAGQQQPGAAAPGATPAAPPAAPQPAAIGGVPMGA